MPFRLTKNLKTVLDAQAANGVGNTIASQEYKDIMIQVSTEGSADLTLRVQGSLSDESPDFSQPASRTNHWEYISLFGTVDAALINGGVGIVPGGTDIVRNFIVNTDGFNFINCEVSSYVAGNVTVGAKCYNNS